MVHVLGRAYLAAQTGDPAPSHAGVPPALPYADSASSPPIFSLPLSLGGSQSAALVDVNDILPDYMGEDQAHLFIT